MGLSTGALVPTACSQRARMALVLSTRTSASLCFSGPLLPGLPPEPLALPGCALARRSLSSWALPWMAVARLSPAMAFSSSA
eukprot:2428205-Pyramimonas_sp.AAC.1